MLWMYVGVLRERARTRNKGASLAARSDTTTPKPCTFSRNFEENGLIQHDDVRKMELIKQHTVCRSDANF